MSSTAGVPDADVRRLRVLLSAGVPLAGVRAIRAGRAHSDEILAAASSIARATLVAEGTLIFGGHPSITPMVLLAAAETHARDQVVIYQSKFFEAQITPEVKRLQADGYGKLVMVPRKSGQQKSVEYMRSRLLTEPLDVAFFVGGMDGIADEAEMFRALQPGKPMFFLRAPGGFAGRLADHCDQSVRPSDRVPEVLRTSVGLEFAVDGQGYQAMAARIIDTLCQDKGRDI